MGAKEQADELRVNLLMDDAGIEEPETRQAAAKFGLMLLDELPDIEDTSLEGKLMCFRHGYDARAGIES